jgi:hypothetical protein
MLTLAPEQIMEELQIKMDELSYALIDLFTYKKYSVQAVKILYNTIDGKGHPTIASGVAFLPVVTTDAYLPMVEYLHGTLTRDLDAPSGLTGLESVIGWIMSMDGYIAVLPDYLGLGVFPPEIPPEILTDTHPYCHAESEASASVDMLKAVGMLCTNPMVKAKPDGKLYLSGYSQGAHAVLATQRELEPNPVAGLTLKKSVAGSGAYSLSFIQKNFLFNNPEYPNPSFLPYLLLGYQDVYENLYTNLNQVFVYPFYNTIPGLFDGSNTVEEIDNQLPANWKSMFVPGYLWNMQYRYFHPVNTALRKNDVINWKPKNDLHLYYCTCDELVAKENSLLAYLSFLLRGSNKVTCLPVGPFSHNDCAPFVLLLAKIQFDCASGINPCGLNISAILSRNKSTSDKDLTMLATAIKGDETLDMNQVYSNRQIAEYFATEYQQTELLGIYPNPANDMAFVEIPEELDANARICLYDMQGRLVYSENITGNIVQLNVKSLQEGVYKVVLNGDIMYEGILIVIR